jgi:hypothetical protein
MVVWRYFYVDIDFIARQMAASRMMELEGNGALNNIDDPFVIAYLQASEAPTRLTSKEQNHIVHRAKWFKWLPFLLVCIDG